jgi:adenylate cyclase
VLKLTWSTRIPPELKSDPHLILRTTTGQYFFPLVEQGQWTIGRDATCEIILLDPLVSRRHAILKCSPTGTFHLMDLGSRNGSFVNSRPVQSVAHLQSGDRLRLGWTDLEFYAPTPPAQTHL